MGGLNEMLMDFGDARARAKKSDAAKKYDKDLAKAATFWSADYDATISYELRGLIKKRHTQIMKLVLSWPGPVILLSPERMASVWENGAPTDRQDWSLECRKDLPKDVDAHVRLQPGGKADVIKLRSGKEMVTENPRICPWPAKDFTVAKLVFDWIGCEAGASRAPVVREYDADQDMRDEITPDNVAMRAQEQQEQQEARQREQVAERARELIRWTLAPADVDTAATRATKLQSHIARNSNAIPFLTDDQKERLGINPEDTVLQMVDLGALVVDYVSRHKRSPLAALDTVPAQEESPARRALNEHADEMLTAHNGDQATRGELEQLAKEFDPRRMAQDAG
ncbi:hypothetical protein [Pseudonocardia sp. T1-2H]|uniref:hypothetical protein n=1 Tax=Pseudonocardia sp. T1-2H TaxID=3128899 RepID=UPI0031010502